MTVTVTADPLVTTVKTVRLVPDLTAYTATLYARDTAPVQKNMPPTHIQDCGAPAPSRGPASYVPVVKTTRPTKTVQSAPLAPTAHSATPAREEPVSHNAIRTVYAPMVRQETVPAPAM